MYNYKRKQTINIGKIENRENFDELKDYLSLFREKWSNDAFRHRKVAIF